MFSPYTEEGIAGPFSSGRSNRSGALDKVFFAPQLEWGTNGDPWRANKMVRHDFYVRARKNLEKGKQELASLRHMNYPQALGPVVQYLAANFAFSLWLEETRFAFYQTWDIRVLSRHYEGFDPALACSDVLQQVDDARSKEEKYRLTYKQWHNCVLSSEAASASIH
ncbi:MAG: hypothetical protein ACRD18_00740 [Terriglobia bacterium]